MATKATLINASGNKVVVDSGSTQAQQYFSQGYQLMGSSGKYVAPAAAPAAPAPTPAATATATPATPTVTPAANAAPVAAPAASASTTKSTAAPVTPATNNAAQTTKLYYKDGTENDVLTVDVPYWNSQGWTTAKPNNNANAAPVDTNKNLDSNIDPAVLAKPGIASLVTSGNAFNETDAKNFAFAKGETNYQQYIGGSGGQANPLYISATNWANLQKTFTPYQLEQAVTRTKDGIYWNPNVNIGEIPAVDPAVKINTDANKIADMVTDAKKTADPFTTDTTSDTDKTPELSSDQATNEASIITMLQNQYGGNAEAIYDELYNTEEMKTSVADVNKYKEKDDEYNQQIEDLKSDIQKEVEGEASDSYISALAAVRGDKILKLQRANQRNLDTATAVLAGLKENAANLLQVRVKDSDTRYNQLFQMLQLQIQQEGTAFNQEIALANIAMNLPENRTITIGGTTYKGLKENDNLNVIQFTDASHKTYVIGVDKKTGAQVYKQYIGTSPSGTGSVTTPVQELANYNATNELASAKQYAADLASGAIAIAYDEKGNSFYYDKTGYDSAYKEATTGWSMWKKNPEKIDYRK